MTLKKWVRKNWWLGAVFGFATAASPGVQFKAASAMPVDSCPYGDPSCDPYSHPTSAPPCAMFGQLYTYGCASVGAGASCFCHGSLGCDKMAESSACDSDIDKVTDAGGHKSGTCHWRGH